MYERTLAKKLGIEALADQQEGPTCGFEAVENVIQQFHPFPNTLSQSDLIGRATWKGCLTWLADGPALEPWGYPLLLSDYGIQSRWHPFAHQTLTNAVLARRGVLVVVDAHQLVPSYYPVAGSLHAVTVTNVAVDVFGKVVEYIGLDSNFPQKQLRWNWAAFGRAASAWEYMPLLITAQTTRLQQRARYYQKNWLTGALTAVL